MPEGADFDASAGKFSWTPKEEQVGRHTVVFTAADEYEVTEKSVEITVKSAKFDTVKVVASADATVKSYQAEKEENYGSQDYVRMMRMGDAVSGNSPVGIFGEAAGSSASDSRDAKITFLSFDAASIREHLEKLGAAELQLTYIGRRESKVTGEDTLLAAPVAGEFREAELKWNNMPAFDASGAKSSEPFAVDKQNVLMAQDKQYTPSQAIDGTKVTIDLTEWVKALPENARELSLAVCDEKGWELAFVSREGAKNMAGATEDMAPSLLLSVEKEQTSDPGNPGPVNPPEVKVKKVSVSAPSKQIAAGKNVALTASVTPKNASKKSVKWSSSNENYATVNSKGVVAAKPAGKGKTVTITATARDGSKKYGHVRIKIMKYAVKKVTIKNKPKTLKAGKKVTLKTAVKAEGKAGKTVNKVLKWSSSNTKYATVSSQGKVTAKKAGKGKTVTITAASTDGTNKKDKAKIKIQ